MKSITFFSLCLLLLLFSCKKEDQPNPSEGEIFDLNFDETALLWEPGMTLRFTAIEEGRCPEDAVCIWEGEAIATMEFTPDAETPDTTFSLAAVGLCQEDGGNCGQADTLSGYIIQLLNIYPHPRLNREIRDSDYFLRLKVEKE